MSKQNLELGRKGETTAVSFLKRRGYKILCTNYRTPLFQIDIVAEDKDTVCFIEVKARRTIRFGAPDEAVDILKQRKISKGALIFLKTNRLLEHPARFDVVSIFYLDKKPQIELIKDAFPLDADYLY